MNRAGEWTQNLSGELAYRSFRPSPLPPQPPVQLDERLQRILAEAHRAVAEVEAMAQFVPDVDLFASMYVRKEALISSQIEGTQCTLDDVLDPRAEQSVNLDVADVVNYVRATRFALAELERLPLGNRLLRRTHERLMAGVRGEEKSPGEFRRTQNWIGPAGCTLAQARFVPPNVEDMHEALAGLERFLNEDDGDPLVNAALAHYQFETIHPFLDGNGRIGRLLVTLYLMERGVISQPVLYVSYFLKRNQMEYYDRMAQVRRSGDYEQWVAFFLEALVAAGHDASQSIRRLSALHAESVACLREAGLWKKGTQRMLEHVERHPITDATFAAEKLGVSFNTAASALARLEDAGVLCRTSAARRGRTWAYERYLAILRPGTE